MINVINTLPFTGNCRRSSTFCRRFFKIRRSTRRVRRLLVASRRSKFDNAFEFILSSSTRRSELRGKLRWNLPF